MYITFTALLLPSGKEQKRIAVITAKNYSERPIYQFFAKSKHQVHNFDFFFVLNPRNKILQQYLTSTVNE